MFMKTINDSIVTAEPAVSIVVPFYNEEQTLAPLCQKISDALDGVCSNYEIIFINDGSTDGSQAQVYELIRTGKPVRLISFRRNFGKSAALSSGFNAARGAVVISMDADLQDDPSEIPRFLTMIAEGADVVSGWKQVRHDPVGKTLPSRLFNAVVNKAFGLELKDHNCGFKAYRAEALRELNLYGELHRFIPALLFARGFQIAQLPVEHHPRRFGQSKFGSRRLVKGALDLMTVWLNTRYGARPLHMFGGGGLVVSTVGMAILGYLAVLWFLGYGPIGNRPLLLFGVLLVLTGVQLVSVGLLGELILSRTIREDDKYAVRETTAALHSHHIETHESNHR